MKTKAQMNWEILKEQEKIFVEGIPEFVNGIETKLFFQGVRQTEYRRGFSDGCLLKSKEKNDNRNK